MTADGPIIGAKDRSSPVTYVIRRATMVSQACDRQAIALA